MQTKTITLITLALLLALLLALPAHGAGTTIASVAFEEGELEFGDTDPDPDANGMDIDFGTRTLPVGPSSYAAADSDHTLRVLDARSADNAGNWTVTVALTTFTSSTVGVSNTFDADIDMVAPSVSHAGLTASDPLHIASGVPAVLVVSANDTLTTGTYDITWAQANIELALGAAAAASVSQPASYSADLTWTLADAA